MGMFAYVTSPQAPTITTSTTGNDHLLGCRNPRCSFCFTAIVEAKPEPFFEALPAFKPRPWVAMKQPARSARRRR